MGKGLNLGRFYRWAGKNGWRGVEQEAGGFREENFSLSPQADFHLSQENT